MWRFTIRELLILTVTAGLAVGWWVDHRLLTGDRNHWRTRSQDLEIVYNAKDRDLEAAKAELAKWSVKLNSMPLPPPPHTDGPGLVTGPHRPVAGLDPPLKVELFRSHIPQDWPLSEAPQPVRLHPRRR
jgi:hypothetical protein